MISVQAARRPPPVAWPFLVAAAALAGFGLASAVYAPASPGSAWAGLIAGAALIAGYLWSRRSPAVDRTPAG